MLVIQEISSTPETSLGELMDGALCQREDWATFVPERLLGYKGDLVVPVLVPPCSQAQAFLGWLHDHPLLTPTLAVLPEDAEPGLLEAACGVVSDFVLWPVSAQEWRRRVARILGPSSDAREKLIEDLGLAKLIGRHPAFVAAVQTIPVLARSARPVLITGETGTGKELVAHAIHHLSCRRGFPFIPVDCGALPDHLIENELFGHSRGAFTDAHADQRGLIALAEGGTLFLDEIDALSPTAQAKLLRFLEERTYRPLGADRFLRANVNVLAATNRNLEDLVRERRFRSDLYYRLNVLHLHLAPLRERRCDIPSLARHFVNSLCADAGIAPKTLTPPALRLLEAHDWPGNVRELLNVLQRAVVFTEGPQILPCHVAIPSVAHCTDRDDGGFRHARARAIAVFEKRYVEELLSKHAGNVTRASREAHKDRRAFGRLIKKHHINRLAV
jgi:DNA-binding NtrC family response regulator